MANGRTNIGDLWIPEFNEKKCACCGKDFIAQYGHIFKRTVKGRIKWYCGYTCYTKENVKEK